MVALISGLSSANIMFPGAGRMDGDFRIGEWLVSPALNQISSNGASARVEPKAMRVLVYLAEHPGVASKEQLIAAVWTDVFVSDDVLPGCISALRKAFNDDARRPKIIETIHKGGYRLLAPVEPINRNGHSHHENAQAQTSWQRVRSKRVILSLAVPFAVLFLIAVFASSSLRHRYDSVAVLPFSGESDPATQYLSDGIAEQVLDDLSQLSSLRVMAWTTVCRYHDHTDVRRIGRDLGVKAILAGQLTKDVDHIVLDTELVDVESGSQLWGHHYVQPSADISALQQQLSQDIASNLRVRLTGNDQERIQHRYTAFPAAYELYLKGRFFWGKRTKTGLNEAIQYFQHAIQTDPNYALAYAGLADSYALLDDWGDTAPRDSFPKAREAAEEAISLDNSLAEAHISLAMVRQAYDWDWASAEQEFRRGIELNPNYATAHQWYGLFLASQGRFKEAEAEVRRAQQLDPLSSIVSMAVAEVYTSEGRVDDSIEAYKRVIALDSSFPGAWGNLSYQYEKKKMYPEAIAAMQRNLELNGHPEFGRRLQTVYSTSGYEAAQREELKKDLQDRAQGKYCNPLGIAGYYAATGEKDRALEWIERGYQEHSSGMQYLATDSQFDSLRSDSRFQYWLGVLHLPASIPR